MDPLIFERRFHASSILLLVISIIYSGNGQLKYVDRRIESYTNISQKLRVVLKGVQIFESAYGNFKFEISPKTSVQNQVKDRSRSSSIL